MTALAYIAGVLQGDGWSNDHLIALKVKDLDFAEEFAIAIQMATGKMVRPNRQDEDYWRVTAEATGLELTGMKNYKPQTEAEICAWLRGFFDSEGNAQLHKLPDYPDSWQRRVAMYSTDCDLLTHTENLLNKIGIASKIRTTNAHLQPSHFGNKPVFELVLVCSANNFTRFAWMVSSSLARKRDTLRKIVLSYKADLGATMRSAQKIGAASRKNKTITVTLPQVVKEIKTIISNGIRPTQRECAKIKGFYGVIRYKPLRELIELATNTKE
jgi:hypothetical protein